MKKYTKIALTAGTIVVVSAVAVAGIAGAKGHKWGGHRGGSEMIKIVEEMDTDGNGAISQAEIDGFRIAKMERFDTNGDGNLNLEEFQGAWMEFTRPRMVDGFQRLDEDGDAIVTMAEIEAPMSRIISRLDRNDDGEISQDELRKRMGRGRGRDRDDQEDN